MSKINRRQFLKTLGIGLGATALVCSGAAVVATSEPPKSFYESLSTQEGASSVDGKVDGKVLIAYASFCGSTGEIAKAIADELQAKGRAVDVCLIKNVRDLAPYSQVIVGSAVRFGQWAPEAAAFVKDHQAELAQKSTAFFTACATLNQDTEENRRTVSAYLDPVRALHKPQHEALFAGKIDYNKLSLLFRLLGQAVKMPNGDFRDWNAIRSWAQTLA